MAIIKVVLECDGSAKGYTEINGKHDKQITIEAGRTCTIEFDIPDIEKEECSENETYRDYADYSGTLSNGLKHFYGQLHG
jgi:hypothetical protein